MEIPVMAKKNNASAYIKLKSTESDHMYHTVKNKKNTPARLELKKYDPTLRQHVTYREEK
jgi:large subunit ribosomal protein L33